MGRAFLYEVMLIRIPALRAYTTSRGFGYGLGRCGDDIVLYVLAFERARQAIRAMIVQSVRKVCAFLLLELSMIDCDPLTSIQTGVGCNYRHCLVV